MSSKRATLIAEMEAPPLSTIRAGHSRLLAPHTLTLGGAVVVVVVVVGPDGVVVVVVVGPDGVVVVVVVVGR